VQIHASLSKDFAGSLLDGKGSEPEVRARLQPLLSVRQVAKFLAVCPATVYRVCERGELPHFRVRNAIRVPLVGLKAYLLRERR
jgi:excisionase family DNA binding protein